MSDAGAQAKAGTKDSHITFRCKTIIRERLTEHCRQKGITLTQFFESAIEEALGQSEEHTTDTDTEKIYQELQNLRLRVEKLESFLEFKVF